MNGANWSRKLARPVGIAKPMARGSRGVVMLK
jgi:hypothetical protein